MNEPNPNPGGANPAPRVTEPARPLFKWLRRLVIGVAALVTLLALFHAEENWRGQRAWRAYRAAMEAKGAVFEFSAFAPPPVPDEENFAMTPLLKPLLDLHTEEEMKAKRLPSRWKDTNGLQRAQQITPYGSEPAFDPARMEAYNKHNDLRKRVQWQLGDRMALVHWQAYYRAVTNFPTPPEPRTPAEDVLHALSRWDAELAELRRAGSRPHTRFNIEYDKEEPFSILLPHLQVLKNVAVVLQLRAIAALELGRSEDAFADVNLILRFVDGTANEPFLITHLVRIVIHEIALQTIWEGLADHRWRPEQLAAWQARLERRDFIAELRRCMETERAGCNQGIAFIRRQPALLPQLVDSGQATPPPGAFQVAAWRLVPRGWFYFEQVNYNRMFDEFILAALPRQAADLDMAVAREKAAAMERELDKLAPPARAIFGHHVLSRLLLPALHKSIERSVVAQATTDMAVIALALERHRLARGNCPESLDALSPGLLTAVPVDPVTHKPFHYRRTEDGRFLLYSVGLDGKDDGGTVATIRDEGQAPDWQKGDWVWPQPKESNR